MAYIVRGTFIDPCFQVSRQFISKMSTTKKVLQRWDALNSEAVSHVAGLASFLDQWNACNDEQAYEAFSFAVPDAVKRNLRAKIAGNAKEELSAVRDCVKQMEDLLKTTDPLSVTEDGHVVGR
jgi:hypothetical protein